AINPHLFHQWDAGSGSVVDRRHGEGDRPLSQGLTRVFWLPEALGYRRFQRKFFLRFRKRSGKPGPVLGRQLPSRARRFILRPDAVHRKLSLGQVPARPKESFNGKPSGKKFLTPPWGMRPQSMKLTRLRLLGFKSFVEPTDFMIEPGLTGVVGPN